MTLENDSTQPPPPPAAGAGGGATGGAPRAAQDGCVILELQTAPAIEYGTVDTMEAGQSVVNGVAKTMDHVLGVSTFGWYVTLFTGGDRSLEHTRRFDGPNAEKDARAVFEALRTPRIPATPPPTQRLTTARVASTSEMTLGELNQHAENLLMMLDCVQRGESFFNLPTRPDCLMALAVGVNCVQALMAERGR